MSQLLVSIIIPTYNRAHLIGETLDSVLAQTYTHWECIIVDDGSTDHTEDFVSNYVIKDSRFKYVHRPNTYKSGANGARNYGFELSQGDFVQWLDSDDLMHPEKLEKQVYILKDKKMSISTCSWGKFDNNKSQIIKISNKPYFKNYKSALQLFNDIGAYGGYLPCHSYLVSRDIINLSGLWNESLTINQDGEFFTRVLINADSISFAPDVFVYYRKVEGGMNTSQNTSIKKIEDRIISWILIEKHIFNKYGIKNSKYVARAKKNIFRLLNNKYPVLRYKYMLFFWKQMLPYKIFNKIYKSFQ